MDRCALSCEGHLTIKDGGCELEEITFGMFIGLFMRTIHTLTYEFNHHIMLTLVSKSKHVRNSVDIS